MSGPIPEKKLHECDREAQRLLPEQLLHFGRAVTRCFETPDGRLFVEGGVGGDEYGNQVNFCPFCGYRAMNTL